MKAYQCTNGMNNNENDFKQEEIKMNENNENKVTLLTIKEASDMVSGLSQYQLRLMVKTKQLPCVQAGRKIFINKEVLLRHLGVEV